MSESRLFLPQSQGFFCTRQWGNSAEMCLAEDLFLFIHSYFNSRRSRRQAWQVNTGVWGLPLCVGEESGREKGQWAEAPAEPDVRPEGDLPLPIVPWDLFLLCPWILTYPPMSQLVDVPRTLQQGTFQGTKSNRHQALTQPLFLPLSHIHRGRNHAKE